jgi:hypothetical protein
VRDFTWERVMRCRPLVVGVLVGLSVPVVRAADVKTVEFHLTLDKNVSPTPFSGRVFVIASKQEITDLPPRPNWFNPQSFFAWDVKGWKPGATLVLKADAAIAFPQPLVELPKQEYSLQAILDLDRGGQNPLAAEGNAHSKPLRMKVDPATSGPVRLAIDRLYPPRKFEETERIKLVDIESPLLSKFHGKPMHLRAGVILPKSFATEPDKRYPVVYEIPGFGGNHHMAQGRAKQEVTDVTGTEMIWVVLDPSCRLGHHVFANSANNGPYGRALCMELIPHVENAYRGVGSPQARLLTGHSSGGWSSLWLQVTYPDFFGGTWSTAPDSVDFRDFQRINIYRDTNVFVDDAGKPRPLARKGGKAVLHYKPFSDMEHVMGRGGQLGSFEAVFSPRGPDGKPLLLWDRPTGQINHAVAEAWEPYDIRLILERSWKTIGPKLAGKLHVYMGAEDTFYLEGATILLKESLKQLGSDAVVEIFPNRDHSTLMDTSLRERIAREMAAQVKRNAN